MSASSDAVDVVHAALEDGYRPPQNPDDWDTIYNVVTGEPCPVCETAIGLILGPAQDVGSAAKSMQTDYGGAVPDDWCDGYNHPVYAYCDRPRCSWQSVAEWSDVRPVFEVWVRGDAQTWREQGGGDDE